MGMMTRGSKITVLASAKENATQVPVSAATPATGAAIGPRVEIEQILRDYLLKNPEVLQEAFAELQKRQQLSEIEARRSSVADNAAPQVKGIYRSRKSPISKILPARECGARLVMPQCWPEARDC